ncbi:MAG TPA: molybdate ABC transporter substrate-binding protein [Kofleriaceae bacterium]|nr:molybdate ABC transporter substrate-binding protein [Kofleriaceae bacterium]
MRPLLLCTCALLLCAAACSQKARGRRVRVAAASDLGKAFEEVGKEFETRSGVAPEITFGSSGLLAKQIEQGAPYFLFAAANKDFITNVVKAGRCDGATARIYGRGRIVVWARAGVTAPATLADLTDAARYKKIAIANPEHAPYGAAAKQALQRSGLWEQVAPRVVLGENIQTTMLYARNGNVDVAIVALSLAVVADGGTYLAIEQSLHDPLDQQLVVCGSGPEADAARDLAAFIASREGREIMTRYGFVIDPADGGASAPASTAGPPPAPHGDRDGTGPRTRTP